MRAIYLHRRLLAHLRQSASCCPGPCTWWAHEGLQVLLYFMYIVFHFFCFLFTTVASGHLRLTSERRPITSLAVI